MKITLAIALLITQHVAATQSVSDNMAATWTSKTRPMVGDDEPVAELT